MLSAWGSAAAAAELAFIGLAETMEGFESRVDTAAHQAPLPPCWHSLGASIYQVSVIHAHAHAFHFLLARDMPSLLLAALYLILDTCMYSLGRNPCMD